MDGENKGSKPYEQMDDLGGFFPIFLVQHPYMSCAIPNNLKVALAEFTFMEKVS